METSLFSIIDRLLKNYSWEELLQLLSNRAVFNAQSDRERRKKWYALARLFHRAMDELKMKEKESFEVSYKDIYTCPKCKHRFRVQPEKELNCKFDMDRSVMLVSCPYCKKAER
jgi:uncharacterized protein YbaR (Trm112 family)